MFGTQSDFGSVLTPPSPSMIAQFAGVLRTLFAGLAGMGVFAGYEFNDAKLTAISAMLLTLGSLVLWGAMGAWSLYQKFESTRADHRGSVASATASANASASAGQPVVIVRPPPPAVQ